MATTSMPSHVWIQKEKGWHGLNGGTPNMPRDKLEHWVGYFSRNGSASPPYSGSPARDHQSQSLSRSRSCSRSHKSDAAANPGNNLYVTGLSTRVTPSELEKYFCSEGKIPVCLKVVECQLVADPHTKESRGFAFVTLETIEDVDHCIKYLNRSVLEG